METSYGGTFFQCILKLTSLYETFDCQSKGQIHSFHRLSSVWAYWYQFPNTLQLPPASDCFFSQIGTSFIKFLAFWNLWKITPNRRTISYAPFRPCIFRPRYAVFHLRARSTRISSHTIRKTCITSGGGYSVFKVPGERRPCFLLNH